MQQQLRDYVVNCKESLIHYDNQSAIAKMYNPVHHARTKHIDIRHHFIRDHVEKKNIRIEYEPTETNTADILTKALAESRFNDLRIRLGMIRMEFRRTKHSGGMC
jgi:hypothetical protein